MQETNVAAGVRLIEQGDAADCLYVVEKGEVNCYKKAAAGSEAEQEEEKLVRECKSGDAFGELGLLYSCPRAASVVAQTACQLWKLDRESFNHIVRDAACSKRERYEAFLKKVPLLESMDTYE